MATRSFRNPRGMNWQIRVDGTTVTEFSFKGEKEPRPSSKKLPSKAEAQRLMKTRIAAKVEEGFVDDATLRAKQKDAKQALKERIAKLKAEMKPSAQPSARKAKAKTTLPVKSPSQKAAKGAKLPPPPRTYVEHIRARGTDGELGRKADRSKRREASWLSRSSRHSSPCPTGEGAQNFQESAHPRSRPRSAARSQRSHSVCRRHPKNVDVLGPSPSSSRG